MFQITRIAYNTTKLGRTLVKNVATKKINIAQASSDLTAFHNKMNRIAPHSKNVFKRAYNWVKTFVKSFKDAVTAIKGMIADEANELGRKLKFREKIGVVKNGFKIIKGKIADFKSEMKKLATTN